MVGKKWKLQGQKFCFMHDLSSACEKDACGLLLDRMANEEQKKEILRKFMGQHGGQLPI